MSEAQILSIALIAAQKRSLEMVVTGAPLRDVLSHLVRTVEEQSGGNAVGSILLLDESGRLRNGASPSLPAEYLKAIDGIAACEGVGTCAEAAATGQVVVTPDFATAPSWAGLAHLPMAIGFKGAWSQPIRARDGSVIGTFGTYFRDVREPTPTEREVVAVLSHTAAIAIERERSETALREREAFSRRLLESSADCIKVLDLDGRVLSMNEAGRRLLQLDDVSDVLGQSYADFWRGADRDAADRAIALARAGVEGRFEGFCPTVRGEAKWWDELITGVPDAEGRPACLLVISRDVTERRETQEELRRAKDAAEAASQAKSRFLAVTSHELRTPLTAVIGYSDLLSAGVSGPLSEQQNVQVSRIKAAAWHLVSIIDEILTFSRLEAGTEHVIAETTDVAALIDDCAELLRPQAQARGIGLRVHNGATAPIVIHTDPGKLRQIVLNLAGNAIKFTDRGEVVLSIAAAGETVRISVCDTGPGIPPDMLESIFEPFVQVDQTNTRTRGGTGLGLSVSRSLARMLGGEICAANGAECGAHFELHVPDLSTATLPAPATIA